jgi:hypothetical protein
MIVRGLDRTDDNTWLVDMPDELWGQHTEEIRREFEENLRTEGTKLSFSEFCLQFFDGRVKTEAMIIHAASKEKLNNTA